MAGNNWLRAKVLEYYPERGYGFVLYEDKRVFFHIRAGRGFMVSRELPVFNTFDPIGTREGLHILPDIFSRSGARAAPKIGDKLTFHGVELTPKGTQVAGFWGFASEFDLLKKETSKLPIYRVIRTIKEGGEIREQEPVFEGTLPVMLYQHPRLENDDFGNRELSNWRTTHVFQIQNGDTWEECEDPRLLKGIVNLMG